VTVWIGTSGWQYRDWREPVYDRLPQGRWLESYAARYATVESNNAFYRLPERATFAAWAARTPADFLMAGACKVVVAGTTTSSAALVLEALRTFRPRRVLVHRPDGAPGSGPLPSALVCAGTACAAPARTAEALRETLATFGRPG